MNIQRVIVVEAYNYTADQVAVTAMCRCCGDFLFLLLSSIPVVEFNDLLDVVECGNETKLYLFRGNEHLKYRLFPLDMPDNLLCDLIIGRD